MIVVIRRRFWILVVLLGLTCTVYVTFLQVYEELQTSRHQSSLMTAEAKDHFYWLASKKETSPLQSPKGPFDHRRGYVQIPRWIDQLEEGDFELTWQAGVSRRAGQARVRDLFPIYPVVPQAGLTVLGDDGAVLYEHRSPGRVFANFEDLPELLVESLLFIENRELLEPGYPLRNPAVEWRRLAHATAALLGRRLGFATDHFGGSTLATQLEKFRHSPGGLTGDESEKMRQILSATLRAYHAGPHTLAHRRALVVDYVNGVPLAASPGYGEVHGMADGLRVWFGADPDEVLDGLRRLQQPLLQADLPMSRYSEQFLQDGRSFRMVLSLLLAHRRPSYYLISRNDKLQELTDAYARIMASQGLISPALRDAVLLAETPVLPSTPASARPLFTERKAIDAVRVSLLNSLGVDTLYELDRHDLWVQSTIDGASQRRVDDLLASLRDREFLAENGLLGHRLLNANAPLEEVTVSFTLFEHTPYGNALRILADNHDQPLNINEHVKLDLGSTAKLRTLVTYLELIAELHAELSMADDEVLGVLANGAPDGLRRWTARELRRDPGISLEDLLEAAMERLYSANPDETFFTGSGLHRFSNFENRRNHTQSVREAFNHSINLVFVRMMRDVVDHFIWLDPERIEEVLGRENTEERRNLLSLFADREGRDFQFGFYQKYVGLDPMEIPDAVVGNRNLSPRSLALVAMSFADFTAEDLRDFMARHGDYEMDQDRAEQWWRRYHRDAISWQDRGYLTRIHPLELWTADWLRHNRQASWTRTEVASRPIRQEVYQWLFNTSSRSGQDRRIRTLLEAEAFEQIHHAWRRLGYPFSELVPSLATSLGSSADRPIALAELVGILLNDGVRYPEYRVDGLIMGAHTPYEARLTRRPAEGQRVLPAAVARVARQALVDVVEEGTARRIRGELRDSQGRQVIIGGKTGTGDHRHKVFSGLQLIDSTPVHRTATFAFLLDQRFFGTLTVFVSGPAADEFRFTSALPASLLRTLYPAFSDLLERPSLTELPLTAPGPTDPGSPLAIAAAGGTPEQIGRALEQRWIESEPYHPGRTGYLQWDAALDLRQSPRHEAGAEEGGGDGQPPSLRWNWRDLMQPEPAEDSRTEPEIAAANPSLTPPERADL